MHCQKLDYLSYTSVAETISCF